MLETRVSSKNPRHMAPGLATHTFDVLVNGRLLSRSALVHLFLWLSRAALQGMRASLVCFLRAGKLWPRVGTRKQARWLGPWCVQSCACPPARARQTAIVLQLQRKGGATLEGEAGERGPLQGKGQFVPAVPSREYPGRDGSSKPAGHHVGVQVPQGLYSELAG